MIKVLLLASLISFSSYGIKLSPKRDRIVSVIDMELKEISRMKRYTKRDNTLDLRMAELNLEKGRIIREQENENFFKLTPKQKNQIDRKKFFSVSDSYYKKARGIGISILKKKPNRRARSHIYYILAYNELENVNMEDAKSLFVKSVRSAPKGDFIETKSRLALGDIYYREGDFNKSRQYYNTAIGKIRDDKWYTKYLYNLAWSNFRVGRKNTAVKQMEQVFELSKSPKYIDKQDMASRDVGYFYAESGKTNKALKFYQNQNTDAEKNFYDMGMILIGKQKYSQAADMFGRAFNGKNPKYKAMSLVQLLMIYDKYGNNSYFLRYARAITKSPLNAEQKKEALYFVTKRAAQLQKELEMSHNKKRPKVMKSKGKTAAELYFISQQIDPKLSERALFFAGESYYAANEYPEALYMYDKVLSTAQPGSTYYKRSLAGMMIVLNDRKISKSTRNKYFETIFTNYIKTEESKSKKNKAVEKLFSFYVDEKKDVEKAKQTFFVYAKENPRNISKNEAMIGRIVDMYKTQKNKKGLMSFVGELKGQGIPLKRGFVNHLNKIILVAQFSDIQKANKSGDKITALKGYLFIYKDPESTADAKRNAAYNIAVLFYESGNVGLTAKWLDRAIEEMTTTELVKFYESFNSIISELFLRQRVADGMSLTQKLLGKTCGINNKNKEKLLKNYIVMGLATRNDSKAVAFVDQQSKCRFNNSTMLASYEQIFDYYIDFKQITNADKIYRERLSAYTKNLYRKSEYVGKLAKLSREQGNSSRYNNELNYIYRRVKNKKKLAIETIDEVALTEVADVERAVNSFNAIELSFPENKFNNTMKGKFARLESIQNQVTKIVAMGSGEAMVKSYSLLISSYDKFSKDVATFTPTGKSQEYVNSFKGSMQNVSANLASKSRQLKRELDSLINKNDVLTVNFGTLSRQGLNLPSMTGAVLMDKRGNQ
ncbi:tetratricopeptide repeat protein [Halobacteriovorax sp. BALOs_7]|uniref:tetratricopeptide repeat protein n=1 Tax=Halobacteriovorax sp. BALOs_7 TaxID=2109558 RepID=UPI000EA01418|nr:tetratricopeptide repeat protein [Halobacteriovorax sp. BALOs_7]AYF43297.1 tetratricopeptide repeat protein [Halobacteriovorax sp. BALOs_7]